MRCPKCECKDNRVIDSREVRNGDSIRRRRACNECGHRFTTYEEIQRTQLHVVKRDSRREELNRDKIVKSLHIACRKRNISTEQVDRTADAIIMAAESEFEKEIPSIELGKKVMTALAELDDVAYIRYASVYRSFRDAGEFMDEVEKFIGR